MLKARDGLGLAPEALARAGEEQVLGPDQLERHEASQRLLHGAVHDAHAAAAEALEQPELAESLGKVPLPSRRGLEQSDAPQGRESPAQLARVLRMRLAGGVERLLQLRGIALEALREQLVDLLLERRASGHGATRRGSTRLGSAFHARQ